MKKTLYLIMLAVLTMSVFIGCAEKSEMSRTEDSLAAQLRSVSISTANTDIITESDFTQEYYLEFSLALDYSAYAANYAESTAASPEFTELWRQSNDTRYYPVLGTHLQSTCLFVVVFYENDTVVKSFTLEVRDSENGYTVTEFQHSYYTFEDVTEGGTPMCGAFHSDIITDSFKDIAENDNTATLYGVVFHSTGLSATYVVGKTPDEAALKYWKNQAWNKFGFIDGFATIEEGRQAYQQYFDERAQMFSAIPVYEWTESVEDTVYFNRFANSHRDGVLGEYETYVAIPLLDEELEENGCVLFLLYYHNDLIGEIVIRGNDAEGEEVWRREASKDLENGQYIPLESSYLSAIEQATASGKMDVKGVSFKDGKLSPVGFNAEGSVMIYDIQTSDAQSVSDYLN